MIRFIVMVGVPGSGKSTVAEKIEKKYDARIHSSDATRKVLFGDEGCQDNPALVFKTLYYEMRKDLEAGKSVIMDATNINKRTRKWALDQVKNINIDERIAVVVNVSRETCIARDAERTRHVGAEVIDRMLDKFQMPSTSEGFDRIEVINN